MAGEISWQTVNIQPPSTAARSPSTSADVLGTSELGPSRSPAIDRAELAREAQLHEWYGDTISRMHSELHAELARLRAELVSVTRSREADRRAVEEACTEQLAVCHCDAVATLRGLVAPIPPLLGQIETELRLEAQLADSLRSQLVDFVRHVPDDPQPPSGWLEALRRILREQEEDGAAGRAALLASLRDANHAVSSAVPQAEAQASAMLAVVRSIPVASVPSSAPDSASASALYLAASYARREAAESERQLHALKEQLGISRRQLAHQTRLAAAKGEEAAVHRHNSERLHRHVSLSARREAELRASHAEALRQAGEREQALLHRLVRAQREAQRAGAPSRQHAEQSQVAAAAAQSSGALEAQSRQQLWAELEAAREQAEAAVHEARFELAVEVDLRRQLQRKNEELSSRLAALEAQSPAHGREGALSPRAAAELERRVLAATAECSSLRAQLQAAHAELSATKHASAALPLSAAPAKGGEATQARAPRAPPTAGTLVTPKAPHSPSSPAYGSDPPSVLAHREAPAIAPPREHTPIDAQAGPLDAIEVRELVESICSSIEVTLGDRVAEAELCRFLRTVNSLQPIGHEPSVKATALCRDFGDGESIPIADFQTIVTKLAIGNPERLVQLSRAWAAHSR